MEKKCEIKKIINKYTSNSLLLILLIFLLMGGWHLYRSYLANQQFVELENFELQQVYKEALQTEMLNHQKTLDKLVELLKHNNEKYYHGLLAEATRRVHLRKHKELTSNEIAEVVDVDDYLLHQAQIILISNKGELLSKPDSLSFISLYNREQLASVHSKVDYQSYAGDFNITLNKLVYKVYYHQLLARESVLILLIPQRAEEAYIVHQILHVHELAIFSSNDYPLYIYQQVDAGGDSYQLLNKLPAKGVLKNARQQNAGQAIVTQLAKKEIVQGVKKNGSYLELTSINEDAKWCYYSYYQPFNWILCLSANTTSQHDLEASRELELKKQRWNDSRYLVLFSILLFIIIYLYYRYLVRQCHACFDKLETYYADQEMQNDKLISDLEVELAGSYTVSKKMSYITDNMMDVIFFLEEDSRIKYASTSIKKLFGWEANAVIGMSFFDFVNIQDLPKLKFTWESMRMGEDFPSMQFRINSADAKTLWVEAKGKVVLDIEEDGIGLVFTIRDIREQKLIQRELFLTEQLSGAVIDYSPLGIAVYTSDGKLISTNNAWEDIWNADIDKKWMHKRNNISLLQKASQYGIDFDSAVSVFKKGGNHYISEMCIGTAGDKWISQYLYAIGDTNADVERVVIVSQDISQHKNYETKLLASEERYRNLVEKSGEGILIFNNGIIKYANEKFKNLIDYDISEPIHFYNFVLQGERQRLAEYFAQLFSKNDQEPLFRTTLVNRQGINIFVEFSTNLIAGSEDELIVFVRDVTYRHTAYLLQKRLLAAIEQVADGIVITDVNADIEYVNPAYEEISGYVREELINNNTSILKSFHHDTSFYAEIWKQITAKQVWKGRIINKRKDGQIYTEDNIISPVVGLNGEIINYVAIKRDVSKEEKTNAVKLQNSKLSAIGTLAGGIAHELNNILMGQYGQVYLLESELGTESTGVPLINEIKASQERAKNLVNNLLAFAREKRGDIIKINIAHELQGILAILLDVYDKITFIQDIDDVGMVYLQHNQVQQLVNSLVDNAVAAMQEEGEIIIELQEKLAKDMANDVLGIYPEATKWACLKIADQGCGMDEDVIKRATEPFFTSKEVGKGKGLGLAIVYSIVSDGGGFMNVKSRPDDGCTVRVFLPLVDEEQV